MAIAKITKGKKSKRLIKYLMDNKPKVTKNGVDDRVMAASGQNIAFEGRSHEEINAQYEVLRVLSDKADKEQQIFHVIQSFARDEFDYRDSAQVARANALGLQLAQKIAGDQAQILVVTQGDNENAMLHNHLAISAIGLDGKSLQTNNFSVKNIRKLNDLVLRENFMEQHKNIKNNVVKGRKTVAEQAINDRGELTKKDIMREKLDDAMSKATSVEEFEEILQDDGVELVRGKRKKEEIFKYRDENDSKAMTDRALGEQYGIEQVLQQIALNAARLEKEKEEEEEREKERKKKELEDSVTESNTPENGENELVQEAEPTQETEKNSLDLLLEKADSLKSIDTRKNGYSGSRFEAPQSDFDLEL